MKLTASIVLYKTKIPDLRQVIDSFFATENMDLHLFLVDNSPTDVLRSVCQEYEKKISYIFNNANLGYGRAHNEAIRQSIKRETDYHIILNPDIYFDKNVISELVRFMNENPNVGNVMPKVLYPDGQLQYLCKLLPTPIDLILRRFIPIKSWREKQNKIYELHQSGYDKIMNVPNLSGCFMFLRVSTLKEVGLFDENIFMYLEDIDLNRRIHKEYKTLFYPFVNIFHEHQKDSYKNKKLLIEHIKSAIYYFNKYGWVFDNNRKEINRKVLKELNIKS